MKWILFLFFIPALARANTPEENRLATGFGIAAPDVGSLLNISNAYTSKNPAGVMYQQGPRISLQIARTGGNNDIGYEGGYSGTTFGAAAGVYTPACSGCTGLQTVAVGAAISRDTFAGLSYQTNTIFPTYGLGFLFNAVGTHRFGLTANYANSPAPNTQVKSYSGGYAYVEKKQTFTLEATQKSDPAATSESNAIMVTSLGYQRRVDSLQVSLNYQMHMNDPALNTDSFWMGAGFNGQTWHLAVYSQYRQNVMFVVSGFF